MGIKNKTLKKPVLLRLFEGLPPYRSPRSWVLMRGVPTDGCARSAAERVKKRSTARQYFFSLCKESMPGLREGP